ncbi:MAG TPA: DUF2214 family protein [Burkholderiales bacterium]|jgi:putative membrane protein|nr:DUF2214 family protein [Burkholderiales bacterium]
MTSFFAFLHHIAAFALVAALVLELVAIKDELSVRNARRLLIADTVYGASATLVLIVGLLRVFYFEKGASYYFHSAPFIAKLATFGLVALLSAYPTLTFLSWRARLKRGEAPSLAPSRLRAIRAIVHLELAGIAVIILCAALMARGVGYFGA